MKTEIHFGMVRKHCGKRRKCWLPAFSPFPAMFSKGFYFSWLLKVRSVWLRVKPHLVTALVYTNLDPSSPTTNEDNDSRVSRCYEILYKTKFNDTVYTITPEQIQVGCPLFTPFFIEYGSNKKANVIIEIRPN